MMIDRLSITNVISKDALQKWWFDDPVHNSRNTQGISIRRINTTDASWDITTLRPVSSVLPSVASLTSRSVFIMWKINSGLWAVGCGLGWTVLKKIWADYEQLLRVDFSTFCGQIFFFFENVLASALKSCIKWRWENQKKNL